MSALPQSLAAVVALHDVTTDEDARSTLSNVAHWIFASMTEREAGDCAELMEGLGQ
jgi:hypothetical protein